MHTNCRIIMLALDGASTLNWILNSSPNVIDYYENIFVRNQPSVDELVGFVHFVQHGTPSHDDLQSSRSKVMEITVWRLTIRLLMGSRSRVTDLEAVDSSEKSK